MIGKLFNTVVDIATTPLKVVTKVADDIMESNMESYVDEIKNTIKIDD